MMTVTFAEFWNAYGIKRDKIAAERAWNRLSAKDRRAAFKGIETYKTDCADHNRMMMYAQGYLNHRRWEDELQEEHAPETTERRQDAILQHAIDLREKEKAERNTRAFDAMKEDLLRAWSQHRSEREETAFRDLVGSLRLDAVYDERKLVRIAAPGKTFNREFTVPYYWDVKEFDDIVARHFNGYKWVS